MKRSHAPCRTLASFVLLFVMTLVTQAQVYETWVAGDGNDANPCTHAAPCQTFAAALSQTNAGGEINAKNAGDFGTVIIDKSITIDGGGTFASILAGGAINGVRIDDSASTTPDTAVVTLRNLSINGAGTTLGYYGVAFIRGTTLNIENCQIFNFSWAGVAVTDTSSNVNIKNTRIFSATIGVKVDTATGSTAVSLNGCSIEQNTSFGVSLGAIGYASIRDSVIQFNDIGVWPRIAGDTINIMGSQINHNRVGLSLSTATTATIGSSTFMANTNNFLNSGTIQTFGNNETDTDPLPGVVTNLGLR